MSAIAKAQYILEQNEDMMASIVENLQMGRLHDCIAQYSILHRNLISLAHDLDNYPAIDVDPFQSANEFPDAILRKDILDEIRPAGTIVLPKPPLPAPCSECVKAKLSSVDCRELRQHLAPSAQFSAIETEEFIHAANVLSDRHRQYIIERMAGKSKRPYKRWNNSEKYTLMVAMRLLGNKETHRIAELMEDRSENQIRSFISHNFDAQQLIDISEGRLPPPPARYQPPPRMVLLFADPSTQSRLKGTHFGQEQAQSAFAPTPSSVPGGWNTLLRIAVGLPQDFSSSSTTVSDTSGVANVMIGAVGDNSVHNQGLIGYPKQWSVTSDLGSGDIQDSAADNTTSNIKQLTPWLLINVDDQDVQSTDQAGQVSSFQMPVNAAVACSSYENGGFGDHQANYTQGGMYFQLADKGGYVNDQAHPDPVSYLTEDPSLQFPNRKKSRPDPPVVTVQYGALHGLIQPSASGQPVKIPVLNPNVQSDTNDNVSSAVGLERQKVGNYGLYPKTKKSKKDGDTVDSQQNSKSSSDVPGSHEKKRKKHMGGPVELSVANGSTQPAAIDLVEDGTSAPQLQASSSGTQLKSNRRQYLFESFSGDSPEKSSNEFSPETNAAMKGTSSSKQRIATKKSAKKSGGGKTKSSTKVVDSTRSRSAAPLPRLDGNVTPPRTGVGVDLSTLSPLFSPSSDTDANGSPNRYMRNIMSQPISDMSMDGHHDYDPKSGLFYQNSEGVTMTGFEDSGTSFFGASNLFMDYMEPSNQGTHI